MTGMARTHGEGGAPAWLTEGLRRLEGEHRLDAAADRLATVAGAVVSTPERRRALRGAGSATPCTPC